MKEHTETVMLIWLGLMILLPIILWLLTGITVRDKWMSAGDDRRPRR